MGRLAIGPVVSLHVVHFVGDDLAVQCDEGDLGAARAEIHAERELVVAHGAGMEDCLSIMSAITALMKMSASSLGPPNTPP